MQVNQPQPRSVNLSLSRLAPSSSLPPPRSLSLSLAPSASGASLRQPQPQLPRSLLLAPSASSLPQTQPHTAHSLSLTPSASLSKLFLSVLIQVQLISQRFTALRPTGHSELAPVVDNEEGKKEKRSALLPSFHFLTSAILSLRVVQKQQRRDPDITLLGGGSVRGQMTFLSFVLSG